MSPSCFFVWADALQSSVNAARYTQGTHRVHSQRLYSKHLCAQEPRRGGCEAGCLTQQHPHSEREAVAEPGLGDDWAAAAKKRMWALQARGRPDQKLVEGNAWATTGRRLGGGSKKKEDVGAAGGGDAPLWGASIGGLEIGSGASPIETLSPHKGGKRKCPVVWLEGLERHSSIPPSVLHTKGETEEEGGNGRGPLGGNPKA